MRRTTALLLAGLALAGRALAQGPDLGDARVRHNPDLVATTEWLSYYVDSASVRVIHVGISDSAYRAGHVPGAQFLPLSAIATPVKGVPNEFPPAAELVARFRALGLGDGGRIVLYGDDAGLFAARAWVALDLLGHGQHAALLDGGLAKWRAEGRPLETAVRPVRPQPFTARWHADRVVSAAWVRAHLHDPSVQLVDARSAAAYAGTDPASARVPAARRGHIPGAANVWWTTQLVSPDNPVLRPMHELHHDVWGQSGADRPAVRTVVTYCQSGMQASYDFFVARYIGYPDVRLYDGSMAEWTGLPAAQYPVEGGR